MSLHWKVRCPLGETEATRGAGLSLPKSTVFCSYTGLIGSQGTPPSLIWLRIAIISVDGSSKITLCIVWDAFHLVMSKHLTHIIWWHSSLSHSIKLKVRECLKPSTKQSGSELTVHRPPSAKANLSYLSHLLHHLSAGDNLESADQTFYLRFVFFFSPIQEVWYLPNTKDRDENIRSFE